MARSGASSFSFPEFRGATRRLVLLNLGAYFGLLLVNLLNSSVSLWFVIHCRFLPTSFLHGWLWQPITYSFLHNGLISTALELLSLWFLLGFLESLHSSNWVIGLYGASVIGTAAAGLAIYGLGAAFGLKFDEIPLYGCFGGIFGLLVAIGILYGDMEFLLFFTIGIKARYMAIIYGLVAVAMLFTEQKMYAFAQLGGALAGFFYIRLAPRRGLAFNVSEEWYALRNRYYRWKRRRVARKFEVYMKSQGKTVRYDGTGRQLDEDPTDKKRWN